MTIAAAVPAPGTRCPRCHHRAPRADGIPCALCAPGDTSPEAAAARHAERMAEVDAAGARVYADLVAALANRADVEIIVCRQAQREGVSAPPAPPRDGPIIVDYLHPYRGPGGR